MSASPGYSSAEKHGQQRNGTTTRNNIRFESCSLCKRGATFLLTIVSVCLLACLLACSSGSHLHPNLLPPQLESDPCRSTIIHFQAPFISWTYLCIYVFFIFSYPPPSVHRSLVSLFSCIYLLNSILICMFLILYLFFFKESQMRCDTMLVSILLVIRDSWWDSLTIYYVGVLLSNWEQIFFCDISRFSVLDMRARFPLSF